MNSRQRSSLVDVPMGFRPPPPRPSETVLRRPAPPLEPDEKKHRSSDVLEVCLEYDQLQGHDWNKLVHWAKHRECREVNLVGVARQKELDTRSMTSAMVAKTQIAMGAEWSKWQQFAATKDLSSSEVDRLIKLGYKVVGTRWVLTSKDGGVKARLVVQGCQEMANNLRTDAPTASRESFALTILTGIQRGWQLRAYDAKTAYLQSGKIGRVLLLRMPRQFPPPGCKPGEVRLANGSIYGTRDAARAWYRYCKSVLEKFGFCESSLEKGLFYHHDKDGNIDVVLHSHVDDFFTAQKKSPQVTALFNKLSEALYLKESVPPFTYCGKRFEFTPDGKLKISQADACLGCQDIPFDSRTCHPDTAVSEDVRSSYRSLLGQMLWLALNCRPDISAAVSLLAQRTVRATYADVKNINRAAKHVRDTADVGLVYKTDTDFDLQKCSILGFGDSSLANVEGDTSQCGVVLLACMPKHIDAIVEGDYSKAVPIMMYSATVKRVVRSTLAAEGYATSETVEHCIYFRAVVEEAMGPKGRRLTVLERDAAARPIVVFSDSNSLVDTATSDSGTPQDKRFRIVVSMLRETFGGKEGRDGDGCELRWCNTHQMLGDGLTKWSIGNAILGSAAIQALIKGARHIVPTGRVGRTAAIAATLASRIRMAGGTEIMVTRDSLAIVGGADIISIFPDHRAWMMLLAVAVVFLGIWGKIILEAVQRRVRRLAVQALRFTLQTLLGLIEDDPSLVELQVLAASHAATAPRGTPEPASSSRDNFVPVAPMPPPPTRVASRCRVAGEPRREFTVREVQTQTVTTYSAVRGVRHPRFDFIPFQAGVWVNGEEFMPHSTQDFSQ